MLRRSLLLAIIGLVPVFAAPSTPQWEIFKLALESSQTFSNPFQDVKLRCVFSKGNRSVPVTGFYDGQAAGRHVFRIRFAPDEQGVWTYRVSSNVPAFDGKTGPLEVTAPTSRGGIVRKAAFPKSFFRADGSTFYAVNWGLFPHAGAGAAPNLGPKRVLETPSENEMNAFIDSLGNYSVNMLIDIRPLAMRYRHIADPSFYPPFAVVDPATWRIDKERFNLAFFQRLDRELARARDRGMFYVLQILSSQNVQGGEDTWERSFFNIANGGWLRDRNGDGDGDEENEYFNLDDSVHVKYVSAMLQYWIARTSAYWNVLYRIGGDTSTKEGREIPTARAVSWFSKWRTLVRDADPYHRPVTLGKTTPEVLTRVGADFLVVPDCMSGAFMSDCGGKPANPRNSSQPDFIRIAAVNGQCYWQRPDYSLPVVSYETPGQYFWNREDRYELERRTYWIALASGWAGWSRPDTHAELVAGNPPRIYESLAFNLGGDPPIMADLKRMAGFLAESNLDLERMSPFPRLVLQSEADVYVLAAPGHQYLAVFPFGGKAVLRLAGGKAVQYESQMFDPRTGVYQAEATVAGGDREFSAPSNQDWVLVIRRK